MKRNSNYGRRKFIADAGKIGLAGVLSIDALAAFSKVGKGAHHYPSADPFAYKQAPLPYAYNALEPAIDALTMEIHYSKHAATYAKNLAEAVVAENVNTASVSLETVLGDISKYSTKMRNNAGGHYNHELFWKLMAAPSGVSAPSGKLLAAIQKDFGSPEAFKTQFADAAKTRFGSGWAWLIATGDKKLVIASTPNQDNPLMNIAEVKGYPVLGIDVWEHAYYLKYQNKRPDYISAWWSLVNWAFVEQRLNNFFNQ